MPEVLKQQKSTHGRLVGQAKKAEEWSEEGEVHYIPFLVARKKIVAMGEQMEKQKRDHIAIIKRLKEHHDITLSKIRKEDVAKIQAVKEGAKKKIVELRIHLEQYKLEVEQIKKAEEALRRQQLKEAEETRQLLQSQKEKEIKQINDEYIAEMKKMDDRSNLNEKEIRKELTTMMESLRQKYKKGVAEFEEKTAKLKAAYEEKLGIKEREHKEYDEEKQKHFQEKLENKQQEYQRQLENVTKDFKRSGALREKEHKEELEKKDALHKQNLCELEKKATVLRKQMEDKVKFYEERIKTNQSQFLKVKQEEMDRLVTDQKAELKKLEKDKDAQRQKVEDELNEKLSRVEKELKEKVVKLEIQLESAAVKAALPVSSAAPGNSNEGSSTHVPYNLLTEMQDLKFTKRMLEQKVEEYKNEKPKIEFKRSAADDEMIRKQTAKIDAQAKKVFEQDMVIAEKSKKIKEKEDIIDNMEKEVRLAKIRLSSVDQKISGLELRLKEKDLELLEAKSAHAKIQAQVKVLKEDFFKAKDERDSTLKRMEDIQAVMDASQGLNSSEAEAKQQIRDLERQQRELQVKLKKQKEEFEVERKRNVASQKMLAQQRDQFKAEFTKKKKDWAELKEKVKTLENEEERAVLIEQIKAQEKEMLILKRSHKGVREKLKESKASAEETRKEAARIAEVAEEEQRGVETRLKSHKQMLDNATTADGSSEINNSQKLANLLLAEKDKVRELELMLKKTKRQVQDESMKILTLNQSIKNEKKKLEIAKETLEQRDSEILELKAKIDPEEVMKLKSRLLDQEKDMKRMKRGAEEAQREIVILQKEATKLKEDLSKTRSILQVAQTTAATAEARAKHAENLVKASMKDEEELHRLRNDFHRFEQSKPVVLAAGTTPVVEIQKLNDKLQQFNAELKSKEPYTENMTRVSAAPKTTNARDAPSIDLAEVQALKKQVFELKQQLNKKAIPSSASDDKEELNTLRAKVKHLESRLHDSDASHNGTSSVDTTMDQKAEGKLKVLEKKRSKLEKEKGDLESKIKILEESLDSLKNSSGDGVAKLQSELVKIKQENTAHQDTIEKVQEREERAKETVANLKTKLKEASDAIKNSQALFESKVKKIDDEHQVALEALVASKDEERNRLKSEMEAKLKEAEDYSGSSAAKKREAEQKLQKTKDTLTQTTKEKEQVEKELADLKAESKTTFERCGKLVEEAKMLNGEIAKQKGIIEKWKTTSVEWENLAKHNAKAVLEEASMRKKLQIELMNYKGNIRVFCRVRPFSRREKETKAENCIRTGINDWTLQLNDPQKDLTGEIKNMWRDYSFDHVFPNFPVSKGNQAAVFEETKIYAEVAMSGQNTCIFAYGQSGTGKTWTMSGIKDDAENEGIKPRMFRELFKVREAQKAVFDYELKVQMIEIYGQKKKQQLRDLFYLMEENRKRKKKASSKAPTKFPDYHGPELKIVTTGKKKKKTLINGAGFKNFSTYEEMINVCTSAEKCRFVRATGLNDESSRSHLITIVHIKSRNKETKKVVNGKLTLVDLAGSEKAEKTAMAEDLDQKQREAMVAEGVAINQSLGMLRNLFLVLSGTDKKQKPQYRGNHLTELLQDSIGGGAKTLMFVNVGPAAQNRYESMDSMKYAEYAKNVVNEIEGEDADLAEQNKELERRVAQLEAKLKGG